MEARAPLTATYRSSVSRTDRPIGAWVTSWLERATSRSTCRTVALSVASPSA